MRLHLLLFLLILLLLLLFCGDDTDDDSIATLGLPGVSRLHSANKT